MRYRFLSLLVLSTLIVIPWSHSAFGQSCPPTIPASFALIGTTSWKYNHDVSVLLWGTVPYDNFSSKQATITVAFENLDYAATFYMYYVNGQYVGNGSGQILKSFVVPVVCAPNGDPLIAFNLKVVNSNYPKTGRMRASIYSISGGTIDPLYSSFITNYSW